MVEYIRIDRQARQDNRQYKRLLLYYKYISEIYENKEFDEIWCDFEIKIKENPSIKDKYTKEILNIDCIKFLEEQYDNDTVNVFGTIKRLLKKESEWEKDCYDYLMNLSKNHPMISKVVVTVLITILIEVLAGIICEKILETESDSSVIIETIDIEDGNLILLDKAGNKIYKISEENGKYIMSEIEEE